MNWMDRAIAAAAPQWGARRARARVQLDQVNAIHRRGQKRLSDGGFNTLRQEDRVSGSSRVTQAGVDANNRQQSKFAGRRLGR